MDTEQWSSLLLQYILIQHHTYDSNWVHMEELRVKVGSALKESPHDCGGGGWREDLPGLTGLIVHILTVLLAT